MMSTQDFLFIYGLSFAIMLVFRCVPLFVLKQRELSPTTQDALSLIPPAIFASLIANDLFSSSLAQSLTAGDAWHALFPFVAAFLALIVAGKTKSMVACIIVGTAAFAIFALPYV